MSKKEERKTIYSKLAEYMKAFVKDESGVGVVEIILIIVVLIGLVILFSEQLNEIVRGIFSTINSRIEDVS